MYIVYCMYVVDKERNIMLQRDKWNLFKAKFSNIYFICIYNLCICVI